MVTSHFPGGKAAEAWRRPPTPSSAEVKKEQSHTSIPFCAFMAQDTILRKVSWSFLLNLGRKHTICAQETCTERFRLKNQASSKMCVI